MKRFILRSILFLLPVFVVLASWEVIMRNFPHVYKFKKDVVAQNCRKNGEIVFLGSSHSYFGVNTEILPNAYNLSYVSQGLRHDYYIFEQLVSKPHKLKCVAVPISIFSLFVNKNGLEAWRERNYVRYWGFPEKSFTDKFFVLDNIPQQLAYVRKYAKRIKRKGLAKAFSITPTGWGSAYKDTGNIKTFGKDGMVSAQRHCDVYLDRIEGFVYLKAIIKLAQQHNMKVVLYTPPGHKTYTVHLNAQQEEKMRTLISEVSSEKGVYYFDLLRSPEFVDEDFFDPDHMSKRGAEKLTLKLYDFYKSRQ